MSETRNEGLSVVGVGVAACVACCAGPILALLGSLGLAGLASTMFLGAIGLLVAAMALAVLLVVRRRRPPCPVPNGTSTPVASPVRRSAAPTRSLR